INCELGTIVVDNLLCGNGMNELEKLVGIWPNPTHDLIHISIPSTIEIQQLSILNAQGKMVSSFTGKLPGSISLGNQEPGMYYLYIQTNQGKVLTKAIIKL
ncbi:MAG: T9SS type A sorting domain-containing protein, partial [Flavobacteriales bacterium]|nr:T9SS type A sorting domain-containing protein [Flavobacteriales bacterium]